MATAIYECCWSECVITANSTDRQYGKTQLDEQTKAYVKRLAGFPVDVISQAFEGWREQNSDPRALPSPSVIASRCAEIQAIARGESQHGVAPLSVKVAGREFVAKHRQFERRVKMLYEGVEHDHRDRWVLTEEVDEQGNRIRVQVGGRDGCPICGPAGDARREQVAEWLAELPQPSLQSFLCAICHDSGWREGGDQRREKCSCKTERTLDL